MPGKKNKQRRNRRNRKKQNRKRPALTPSEVVLQDAKHATHPLHTWPTAIVVILLSLKTEMEEFERGFNSILRQVHGNYVQTVAIWLHLLPRKNPVGIMIGDRLARMTMLLSMVYKDMQKDQMYTKDKEDDMFVIQTSTDYLQLLFETNAAWEMVAKKALRLEGKKRGIISTLVFPPELLNWFENDILDSERIS